MSTNTASAENNFRYLIEFDGGIKCGYWKGEEVDFGSEVNEDWDPEVGPILVGGGRQTADDLKLERPWISSRDRAMFTRLKPLRGRIRGTASLFEFDEFDQPTTSAPLSVDSILLTNVVQPPSSESGDAAKMKMTVKVQA